MVSTYVTASLPHHHIFYSRVHDTGYDTPTMATLRLVVMGVSTFSGD